MSQIFQPPTRAPTGQSEAEEVAVQALTAMSYGTTSHCSRGATPDETLGNESRDYGRTQLPSIAEMDLHKEMTKAQPVPVAALSTGNLPPLLLHPISNYGMTRQPSYEARENNTLVGRRMSSDSVASLGSTGTTSSESVFGCFSPETPPSLVFTTTFPGAGWKTTSAAMTPDAFASTSSRTVTPFRGLERHPARSPTPPRTPPRQGQRRGYPFSPAIRKRASGRRVGPKEAPHNNFKYTLAGQDFIFYHRVDRETHWDPLTALYNAARHHLNWRYAVPQKEEPERRPAGVQGIFYRRRFAGLPKIDSKGRRVLDEQTGYPVIVPEFKERPEKRHLANGQQGARATLILMYPERVRHMNYDFVSQDDMAEANRLGKPPRRLGPQPPSRLPAPTGSSS